MPWSFHPPHCLSSCSQGEWPLSSLARSVCAPPEHLSWWPSAPHIRFCSAWGLGCTHSGTELRPGLRRPWAGSPTPSDRRGCPTTDRGHRLPLAAECTHMCFRGLAEEPAGSASSADSSVPLSAAWCRPPTLCPHGALPFPHFGFSVENRQWEGTK